MKTTDILLTCTWALVMINLLMTAYIMGQLREVEETADDAAAALEEINKGMASLDQIPDDAEWILIIDSEGNVYALDIGEEEGPPDWTE